MDPLTEHFLAISRVARGVERVKLPYAAQGGRWKQVLAPRSHEFEELEVLEREGLGHFPGHAELALDAIDERFRAGP